MKKGTITFENGNRAVVIIVPADANAETILKQLGLAQQPRALIMVFGGPKGLDDSRKAHVAELFNHAIARVAAEWGALIIDGGTQSGIMAMMGEAVVRDGRRSPLLGVAPAGKVSYSGNPSDAGIVDDAPLEPNHSHFVLVENGEWGAETEKMLELARTFHAPIVAILVNGGAMAADQAVQSVRNGWQLLVVEGTGRFADELGVAVRDGQSAKSTDVSEIVRSGRVALLHVDDSAEKCKNELRQMLCCCDREVHGEKGP